MAQNTAKQNVLGLSTLRLVAHPKTNIGTGIIKLKIFSKPNFLNKLKL